MTQSFFKKKKINFSALWDKTLMTMELYMEEENGHRHLHKWSRIPLRTDFLIKFYEFSASSWIGSTVFAMLRESPLPAWVGIRVYREIWK